MSSHRERGREARHGSPVERPGSTHSVELPMLFLDWQRTSRMELFDHLLTGEPIAFLASHLPVLASKRPDGGVNLANKGVGPIPREEFLPHYIDLYRKTLDVSKGRSWKDSLGKRIHAVKELLLHPEHIDSTRLGSLEIFEGETFRNIGDDRSVSLLYTGEGPHYPSFQIDAQTTIVKPGEPAHEFLVASRQLFEYEHFHLHQPGYPYGYVFHVTAVKDKAPKRRCPVK